MTEAIQPALQPLNRGRPMKFTAERMQQVRNLVERGKSREEIAEIIGVTTGSLQVTCSKLGISLRRPTFNTGIGLLPRQRSRAHQSVSPTQARSQPENSRSESATWPRSALAKIAGQTRAGAPRVGVVRSEPDDGPAAAFAIRMVYKGQERLTDLPIHEEIMGELAMEAEIRGMGIGELVGALILAIVKKDLLELIADGPDPHLQSPDRPLHRRELSLSALSESGVQSCPVG